ncbi:hypothetical protein Cni_G17971 [Canna indica]|uniref:PWWP domain-containing protein n=1 Tax=Canna indica TaxID=4628 RepID=A0AAQ3KLE1_9LILI|nr:hypothetical protein Cni_G17971 [Canna indica]
MTSVANQVEISRAPADPSFEVGDPGEGQVAGLQAAAGGSGVGRGYDVSRVSIELDPAELKSEMGGTVTQRGIADLPGNQKDAPGNVELAMGGGALYESNIGERVSAAADAGAEFAATNPEEGRDFDDDTLSDEVVISDGVRIPHGAVGNWMNGFDLGDMVWGKVKSHPWWPGHIFNEAFATFSVRRSRREGHVLVAFFGDSSYGWFDPAELIPFDPHYEEKSRQTNLRPFVKAVEEAADETSRRAALALTCYCRNKLNFRPSRVPGYFSVDIPGFEPGGIYSSKQISSARDKFVPEKALSFVQHAALDPLMDDVASIDRIKSIAMLFAYRRAVFEEFDETYAQAFGVEPVRPSPRTGVTPDQHERFAPRGAPLSGPLVVAEPLRHKKSSSNNLAPKATKLSSAKKNKYVLKRRDEQEITIAGVGPPKPSLPDIPTPTQPYRNYYNLFPAQQQQQQQQSSATYTPHLQPTLVFQDPSSPLVSSPAGSKLGDYVLQKRAPAVTIDEKQQLPPPQDALNSSSVHEDRPAPVIVDIPVVSSRQASEFSEVDFRKIDPAVAGVVADGKQGRKLKDVMVSSGAPKEKKMKKRAREDVRPDGTGEIKKKKKKKKGDNNEVGLAPGDLKTSKIEDPDRKPGPKSITTAHELGKRGDGAKRTLEPFAFAPIQLPKIDLSSRNLQLPELVSDLHELALNPFYCTDRDAPWIALHVFLKFRSLVFQKSLPSQLAEPEASDIQPASRSLPEAVAGGTDLPPAKTAKDERELPSASKLPKASSRSDDPTVAGRKRTPSDRQEEMSAKRQKKLDKLKCLAGEKKAAISQKGPEGPQREQKEFGSTTTTAASASASSVLAASAKPNNKAMELVKKQEALQPPRSPSPTTLVMKFPPRTTLPSVASLKARFARFGALELSGTRVYWKSNTCKVVFKYKSDAEVALNNARANEMFGQIKVHFYLRDADATDPLTDVSGQRPESRPSEGIQFRPGNDASSGSSTSLGQSRSLSNPNQRPTGQLKSILKKPGDDAGPSSGGGREAPRVKFMLDGVNGKSEMPPPPAPVVSGSNNGRCNTDVSSSSLPPLEPAISKTSKSVTFLPPPPSFPRPPQPYPPRVLDNPYVPPPPMASVSSASILLPPPLHRVPDRVLPPPPIEHSQPPIFRQQRSDVNKDFANQMLSLLVRCSDLVSSVKSSLGYVPYHQL